MAVDMLAWVCDLIVATGCIFPDPVVKMGIPGVEYFAHCYEMPPRIAKILFGRAAQRAYELGMVNRVVTRNALRETTLEMAQPDRRNAAFGFTVNQAVINTQKEDNMGKRSTMDMAFGYHHFAHVHNEIVSGDKLGGYDGKAMAQANKAQAEQAKKKGQ